MIPLSDGIPARRFPIMNVALILANFCVWIFYELPHLNSALYHASFYACTVNSTCHGPEPLHPGATRLRHDHSDDEPHQRLVVDLETRRTHGILLNRLREPKSATPQSHQGTT
jgi:hypothetical protein